MPCQSSSPSCASSLSQSSNRDESRPISESESESDRRSGSSNSVGRLREGQSHKDVQREKRTSSASLGDEGTAFDDAQPLDYDEHSAAEFGGNERVARDVSVSEAGVANSNLDTGEILSSRSNKQRGERFSAERNSKNESAEPDCDTKHSTGRPRRSQTDDDSEMRAEPEHVSSSPRRRNKPESTEEERLYAEKLRRLFENTRFFLIKSNNHENVSLSKAKRVWSTLPHTEQRLNLAYRVSSFIISQNFAKAQLSSS